MGFLLQDLSCCVSLTIMHMSCRSLVLTAADPEFLELADDSLPSLSLQEPHPDLLSPSLAKLARLSCLTRLELRDVYARDSMTRLRGLPLQELVLIDCPGAEEKLFVPAALTTLRRLHIEERHCDGTLYEDEKGSSLAEERQLQNLGDIVLQLPELMQVSGFSNLLAIGLRAGLRSWEEGKLARGTMVSQNSFHRASLHQMKIWRKVENQY